MKTFIKATLITAVLTCTTLYAGGSHSHDADHGHSHTQAEASKASIEKAALSELARLIQNNKIDQSWSNTPIEKMQKKQFHHNMEWVASFKNTKIQDKSKQTLYIFLSLYGKSTGANYTGK